MTSSPAPARLNANTPYYVIIGCGFSGILNHVLLRHTSSPRLGGLTILHIGEQDPWRSYYAMPMGQWPSLLTLPGFQNSPSVVNPHTNLGSDVFAAVNDSEWHRLLVDHPFCHVPGRVTAIRKPANRPYEVVLEDKRVFRAEYVDVCGGPGPARTPPSTISIDPTLLDEFNGSPVGPGNWPRLVSGEDFLTTATPAVPPEHRICVYGGGPTGAWCVERAQNLGHKVSWVAAEELNGAFIASRRNDDLLQSPVVRETAGGDHVVIGRLRPASPTTLFGENLVATSITPTATDEVEISFASAAPATWRFTGNKGPIPLSPVLTLRADQVVLSIGQETRDDESRSWASLLREILDEAIHTKKHLILDRHERVVGLQSDDECIRVLGAAALSHPLVSTEWKKPRSPSNLFFRSLIEQARVQIGITLSAVTLAEANKFWSNTTPNDNLNTCGFTDLEKVTKGWSPELQGAQTWFEMRGHRIPPFMMDEFCDFVTGVVSY